ncbi:DUF1320 domain-containing protein [Acinetobacter venetianus]|uniref:DUF1320 domain-containing protein n=1 Tax=Acinetobacter venetianus TaxID=52133 RepID=UPI0007784B8E|nr:DUF1320 domain-containing protein [Acinetobacter venetianus]KXZ66819.1 hypothetical protein AVENLUH7437_00633 [Acinetobacter venetianus]
MSYCTVDDVKQLIPESTLRDLTQDDPEDLDFSIVVVNSAIKYATDKINAAIRGRYPLPLKQKVDFLKELALDLVRYRLYSRRPDGGDLPSAVVDGKKSAENDLKSISRGELSLGIEDTQKPVDEAGPWRIKVQKRRFDGGMR